MIAALCGMLMPIAWRAGGNGIGMTSYIIGTVGGKVLYEMVHATRRRYEVLSGRRFCKSCTTAGILFLPTTSGHTWRPRSALALDGVSTECDRSAPAMMQSITIMERTRRAPGYLLDIEGGERRRSEQCTTLPNLCLWLLRLCPLLGSGPACQS